MNDFFFLHVVNFSSCIKTINVNFKYSYKPTVCTFVGFKPKEV